MAGRNLRYRVYRGMTHWWWEYENRQAFRRRFKSDRGTELLSEERVLSAPAPVDLVFEPEEGGEYLIEVADGDDRGHTAAFFLRAYHWGRAPEGGSDGVLALKDRPGALPARGGGRRQLSRAPAKARSCSRWNRAAAFSTPGGTASTAPGRRPASRFPSAPG